MHQFLSSSEFTLNDVLIRDVTFACRFMLLKPFMTGERTVNRIFTGCIFDSQGCNVSSFGQKRL